MTADHRQPTFQPISQEALMNTQSTDQMTMQADAIKLESSLLQRAKRNDFDAVTKMFRQFMSPDEEIYFAEYSGHLGFWIFGTHSFACLTNRRLASLQVGSFGRVLYNDGFLEHHNSGLVYQPSLLKLYLWSFFAAFFGLLVFGSSLVLAPQVSNQLGGLLGLLAAVLVVALGFGLGLLAVVVTIRIYYSLNKCGLLWFIREGISVYVFTNRGRLNRANHLYRLSCQVRDERLKAVGSH
jgi:hypothetical protein